MELNQKISILPQQPGVYIYKNEKGKILYIGKAKILKNRVRSYFQKNHPDAKVRALVSQINDIEYIICNSEKEALILEYNLIKKHRPPYNIQLKDTGYPYIKITNETFPRIIIIRKIRSDGARYLGPFTSTRPLKATLKLLNKLFPSRQCKKLEQRKRPCLNYQIKKCPGVCAGLMSNEDYIKNIESALSFLTGHREQLAKKLEKEMYKASDELNFEKAAILRDQIDLLRNITRRRQVVDTSLERDYIAITRDGDDACAVVIQLRDGKILGKESFILEQTQTSILSKILKTFLQEYYMHTDFIPVSIDLQELPEDANLLEEWLRERRGKKITFHYPQKGERLKLLQMALNNAQLKLEEEKIAKEEAEARTTKAVKELQEELKLPILPRRIIAFDISNLSDTNKVASLVTFVNGIPRKKDYRRFRIKTVIGQDDFACMAEVVTRHFTRLLEKNMKLPDLILIDGGKGQLHSAKIVLDRLNIKNQMIIGLAKRLEEIYLIDKKEPIILKRNSKALLLLQKIRDEAHRFAIAYHRKLRKKTLLKSELEDITGIGRTRSLLLLKAFGSVAKIKEATFEELTQVKGFSEKYAHIVYDYFHPPDSLTCILELQE